MSTVPTADAPKLESTPKKPTWLQPRLFLAGALALLLWPALILIPGGVDASLDGSWPEVLLYAHAKGWQFGRDIVFTWGPWGFLNNFYHLGDLGAVPRLFWETFGKLGIAVALVTLTRRLPVIWQVLFILSCICFNWLFLDTVFLVLITLIVMARLLQRETSRGELLGWMAVLAFLGQIKFTYTLFGCAGVGAAVVLAASRRELRFALLLAVGYPSLYALLWLISGQNPDNLVPFFRLSMEISSGFGDAMAIDELNPVFYSGTALALLCLGFLLWLLIKHPDRLFGYIATGYLALTWYITWKHGFVRADSHVFGFYLYSILMVFVLPSICFPECKWHWFQLIAIYAVICIGIYEPGLPQRCPGVGWACLRQNVAHVLNISAIPEKWRTDLKNTAQPAELPAVKREVADKTVDVFNYDQGVALLNNLNYTPRPIFQSYSAFTPRLMAKNHRFYQSPKAPEYVLWKQISIDGRYPTTDDALLVPELPRSYKPVLEEGGFLLLKKQSALPARLERKPLLTRPLRIGEVFTLPQTGTAAIWFQATLPLNKLGKLRALLYKPPLLDLIVTDETGHETSWRLLPRIAEEGFLLSPLLETQADFTSFCRGHGRHWIRALRLSAPRKQKEFWAGIWDCAEIRLYTLPELTLDHREGYQELVEAGITNLDPTNAKSDLPLEPFMIGSTKALFFHARSSLTFSVPPKVQWFSGTFGLRDGAFEKQTGTDGVEFVISAIALDGTKTVLWQRLLDPLHEPSDRGPQQFAIEFAPGAHERITLEALPGPKNNTDWDWSYVANLRFEPSEASP